MLQKLHYFDDSEKIFCAGETFFRKDFPNRFRQIIEKFGFEMSDFWLSYILPQNGVGIDIPQTFQA